MSKLGWVLLELERQAEELQEMDCFGCVKMNRGLGEKLRQI